MSFASHRGVLPVLRATVLFALVVASAPLGDRCEAAARTTLRVVTAGMSFTGAGDEVGLLAMAATLDPRGTADGAVVVVLEEGQRRATMSMLRGEVETVDGGLRVRFRGTGELMAEGRVVERDVQTGFWILDHGSFEMTLGDLTLTGTMTDGGVTVFDHDFAEGGDAGTRETGTHEVGHWIGVYYDFPVNQAPMLAFGAISFGDTADVEGHPEVAGLFADTADGETGKVHGHLDVLRQVGDPATGRPLSTSGGFEASGTATCVHPDGSETLSDLALDLDLAEGVVAFRAPGCDFDERLPIAPLPAPGPSRRTVIVGPDAGLEEGASLTRGPASAN